MSCNDRSQVTEAREKLYIALYIYIYIYKNGKNENRNIRIRIRINKSQKKRKPQSSKRPINACERSPHYTLYTDNVDRMTLCIAHFTCLSNLIHKSIIIVSGAKDPIVINANFGIMITPTAKPSCCGCTVSVPGSGSHMTWTPP